MAKTKAAKGAKQQGPPPPFPIWGKQAEFIDTKEMVKGLCAGVGSGKSVAGALDLLYRTLPDRLYMVTSPTYRLMKDSTFRTFQEVFSHHRMIARVWKGEDFMAKVKTRMGGFAEILFRSTEEPERLKGMNLSGVWMDEAQGSSYEAYQNLVGRLREKGTAGWLTATFTPKGLSHWTYAVFGPNRKNNVACITARTDENPFLSEGYLENMAGTFSGNRARQEVGGEFVSTEGAEWPETYFTRPDFWYGELPPKGERLFTVLSLDPSKGKDSRAPKDGKPGDYSAYVWGTLCKDGRLYLDADLDNRRDVVRIVEDGVGHCVALDPKAFIVETNQFQSMLATEFLRISKEKNLFLPVWGIVHNDPKPVRIRTLGPYLSRGELRFKYGSPGAELVVQQLRDWPQSPNDDGPDAAQMMITMARYLLTGRGDVRPAGRE